MENNFVFLAMWLVPPSLFVLTGMFMVYYKGWTTDIDSNDNPFINTNKELINQDASPILCLFGFLFPSAALVYYCMILDLPVTFGGGSSYILFEFCGSWVIYGIFTLTGIHSWYGVKERHMKQKCSMNVDFDSLQVSQYVVRTRKDKDYQKPYRLELEQVQIEKDVTGEYKVLNNIENWGNSQFWTEQEIKDTLSDFFKARNLFYIDNENGFGIIQVEQNKPKIIVIE